MKTRNLEDVYELLPMQQGILFHSLSAPKSGVYLEQLVFNLRGEINVEVFQKAWQAIVDQYPIMRTSFHWKNLDKPVQVVHRKVAVNIEEQDWSAHAEGEVDAMLESWLKTDRLTGFDFTKAPQMRITVFKTGKSTCKFAWCFPHLIMDGWSVGLVLQAFVGNYKHFFRKQQTLQITESDITIQPSRPYRDYLTWWKKQDPAKVEPYWKETLSGYSAPPKLTVGCAPGIVAVNEATHERLEITLASVADELEHFVRQHQLTMNTMILAAWGLLLSRYYGVNDLIIGATSASRPSDIPDVGAIVGPMIVSLPIRMNVDPEAPLVSWLTALQAQQSEVREHEHGSIVQLREWSELPHSVPLFESIIAYENVPFPKLSLSEEGLDILDFVYDGRPQYPVSMVVFPGPDLPLRIVYDRRRFEQATIERMLHHVEAVLREMLDHPDYQLKQLSYLTPAERQQVMAFSSGNIAEYDQSASVHHLFEHQVKTNPENVALCYENESLTYAELNRRSNQLAHYLVEVLEKQNNPAEPMIGLCVERSVNMIVGLLAILKAGGVYVPLDATYPKSRLSYIIEDADINLILTQESLLTSLPADKSICLDGITSQLTSLSDENLDLMLTSDRLAYIIYTSGSTGRPKGVMLEHRGLCNMSLAQIRQFEVHHGSRVLHMASPGFDASVSEVFMALLCGATLVEAPQKTLQPGLPLIKTLENQEISHVTLVPSVLSSLSSAALPQLKVIISAGEACSSEIIERWGKGRKFYNAYGPTETTVCATIAELNNPEDHAVIGKPIDNVQVLILDPWKKPVAIGVTGELYIGGPGVARGYIGQPELTQQQFIMSPFAANDAERLYRTGDQARYRTDGSIEFVGRADNQVKIRGCRIELEEVEQALAKIVGVENSTVLVGTNSSGENQLWAYVVPRKESDLTGEKIRELLKLTLPEFMLPSQTVLMEKFPLLSSGKLDRSALPSPHTLKRTLEDNYEAPRNPIETQLVNIWQQLLDVSPIGVKDDFYALGGHSLLALGLMGKIQSQFGTDLSLDHLHLAPTIEQQAALLQRDDISDSLKPTLARIKSGTKAPLFCVHPVGGTTLCYSELAQHLDGDQPVYGLQSPGVSHDKLEQVASEYITLIRKRQSTGPYYLLGWSTGGTLAYEIAQQLHALNEEVGLLALFDPTFLVSSSLPKANSNASLLALFLKQLTGRFELSQENLETENSKGNVKVEKLLQRAQSLGWLPPEVNIDQLERRYQLFKASLGAHKRYKPKPFEGPASIFVASESVAMLEGGSKRKVQWSNYFSRTINSIQAKPNGPSEVGYHVVPGDHYSMLSKPNVETLAEQLLFCVNQSHDSHHRRVSDSSALMGSAEVASVTEAI